MYSAVLMLAVLAGNDSVDHGGRNRGCTNVISSGCASSTRGCIATTGCAASNGCSRGHGLFNGGLFRRGSSGCNCGPVAVSNGCNGCSRGHGLFNRHGGCAVSSTGCAASTGCATTAPATVAPKKDMPKGEPVPEPKPKKTTQAPAPATIIVNLPADARLIVDGAATTSTTEVRTFVTPNLDTETTFAYTMRAEIVRDGVTVDETLVVNVTGGQTSNVRFNFSQTVASR